MAELKAQLLRTYAAHEAGHAVARWWLDRRHYLGRYVSMPALFHVAINRDDDEVLLGSRGDKLPELGGVCAGGPCVMPSCPDPRDRDRFQCDDDDRPRLVRDYLRRATADLIHVMSGPCAEALHVDATYQDDEAWREGPIEDADDWRSREHEVSFVAIGGEVGTDWWQIEERIPLLGRRWRLHLQRAFELANHVVRQHQRHINSLADALVHYGQIDGETVYHAFDEIGPALRYERERRS